MFFDKQLKNLVISFLCGQVGSSFDEPGCSHIGESTRRQVLHTSTRNPLRIAPASRQALGWAVGIAVGDTRKGTRTRVVCTEAHIVQQTTGMTLVTFTADVIVKPGMTFNRALGIIQDKLDRLDRLRSECFPSAIQGN